MSRWQPSGANVAKSHLQESFKKYNSKLIPDQGTSRNSLVIDDEWSFGVSTYVVFDLIVWK